MASTLYSLDHLSQFDKRELVQELWSGYGEIVRLTNELGEKQSVILKKISAVSTANHPRGWNTSNSHSRKLKSYQVEIEFYKKWSIKCNNACRVPLYFDSSLEENNIQLLIEDLDQSDFSRRKSSLSYREAKVVLRWLAHFHATFMNIEPKGLWKEGTYWHLETRPDELEAMPNGELKRNAKDIATCLKQTDFQTIVHGDAKVANFCFNEDLTEVAAVDFQYVGGGCGMKDLVYFIGSCLTEKECGQYESEILDFYFLELKFALKSTNSTIDFDGLEQEWRALYPFAWADFSRFLLGWSPSHQKLNGYALKNTKKALQQMS